MANWLLAMTPSLGAIFYSFSDRFKTRKSSFMATSPLQDRMQPERIPLYRRGRKALHGPFGSRPGPRSQHDDA
ncbi:hypothetical protein ABB55_23905 [Prosthecomicrobium hirschii]|uniref:Uncharacterized protein n=1 Tax=Prosthecodimorpha hirschii TaxID=665126 RepID=A0A0P6W8F9_9HYPH|nr:hypothetical protein ABB55_23905 [Prosthecomicrobium hirschii]